MRGFPRAEAALALVDFGLAHTCRRHFEISEVGLVPDAGAMPDRELHPFVGFRDISLPPTAIVKPAEALHRLARALVCSEQIPVFGTRKVHGNTVAKIKHGAEVILRIRIAARSQFLP